MQKLKCPVCGRKHTPATGVTSAYWARCFCGYEIQITPGFWKATVTNWRKIKE
ncbi:unnamed protein product [marine sediment metagenome]|uniref:Uncharacterized protein n=1 Tax=marine sediment metagenome TaxID=412755 RepID=X1HCR0_9ZZZZ